jgi:hypothetical protein
MLPHSFRDFSNSNGEETGTAYSNEILYHSPEGTEKNHKNPYCDSQPGFLCTVNVVSDGQQKIFFLNCK